MPTFDQVHLFSAKSKSILLAANHTEDLATSIASAYWGRFTDDDKKSLPEGYSYQHLFEMVQFGLVNYIALEEFPPYSRGDLKTLKEHLLGLIDSGKISTQRKLNDQLIFDLCMSWGEKLKSYGLVASMKTQSAYY
ncbi:MAG: hypothetical protein HRU09_17430 [Oligoflexales bacterium]|nr:hypothetical protein [Oligoflexales bacterium]